MELALAEAHKAYDLREVPIGAVIVLSDRVIGRGHNLRESSGDPTAHAEMLAIQQAARNLGTWRLDNTVMYVTVEPCPMCAGALVLARVRQLVFGAPDPKAGACGSLMNIVEDQRLNHRLGVVSGVMAEACAALLQRFFQEIRKDPEGCRRG
ncbi:MAG TPA: tRNA-specific adenosine deaminase [Clostridiales bacterium UBA8153]|nr:tRNA-specific adenosine deaminase [Clostridiales bacterium UBA8153]